MQLSETGNGIHLLTRALLLQGNLREFQTPVVYWTNMRLCRLYLKLIFTETNIHLLTKALLLRGNLSEFQTPYMSEAVLSATTLVTKSPGVAIAAAMPLGSVVSAMGAASEVEMKVETRARQMVKAVTSILKQVAYPMPVRWLLTVRALLGVHALLGQD